MLRIIVPHFHNRFKQLRTIPRLPIHISLLWLIGWEICFIIAMSLAKSLGKDINGFVLIFLRCLFGLLFLFPLLTKNGFQQLKTKRPILNFIRVIFLCMTIFCTYYSYRYLPMATVASIGFISSLITPLLAIILLKEAVTFQKWILIILGYIGTIIVIQPSASTNGAMYVALLASLLAGIVTICTKKLTSTESTFTMLFYAQAACFLISSLAVLWVWETPSQRNMIILCLIGLAAIMSQFCYVKALKNGKASFLAPFEYTRLITASIFGFFIFNEVPDFHTVIGASIIFFSTFYLYLLENSELHFNKVR